MEILSQCQTTARRFSGGANIPEAPPPPSQQLGALDRKYGDVFLCHRSPFDRPVLSDGSPFDRLRANGVEGLSANGVR